MAALLASLACNSGSRREVRLLLDTARDSNFGANLPGENMGMFVPLLGVPAIFSKKAAIAARDFALRIVHSLLPHLEALSRPALYDILKEGIGHEQRPCTDFPRRVPAC